MAFFWIVQETPSGSEVRTGWNEERPVPLLDGTSKALSDVAQGDVVNVHPALGAFPVKAIEPQE